MISLTTRSSRRRIFLASVLVSAGLAVPLGTAGCSDETGAANQQLPPDAGESGIVDAKPDLTAADVTVVDVKADSSQDDSSVAADVLSDSPVGKDADASLKDSGPPEDYYALNHVLCTGQSLSLGTKGVPALSTSQPYSNKMFNSGLTGGPSNLVSFVDLIETHVGGEGKPVETMSSGMANQVTAFALDLFPTRPAPYNSHDLLISCHGRGGTAYSGLKKGGDSGAFEKGMAQTTAARAIAQKQGLSYIVRAVTVVHGENDDVSDNTHYAEDMVQWQEDYEHDVKTITGQTEPVPLFHSQISSWTHWDKKTSHIPGEQLRASLLKPDKIILVCPKYFFPYSDGLHLTNVGYRWMGEYYAKAYRQVILEGKQFKPLMPIDVSRSGKLITVTFHVPVPPLFLDVDLVTGKPDLGFEYYDDGPGTPDIVGVKVQVPDKVVIELSSTPTAANKRIAYAFTGIAGADAGPTGGPRGNLRDSDETKSRDGKPLFNWAVHFMRAVD